MTNTDIALIMSGIALLISFISLWKSSLSSFKLKISQGFLTFMLYEINEDEEIWWIPSIDIAMTFHNKGALPGEVIDLRIVAQLSNERYVFYPRWVVDYQKFHKLRDSRNGWLENAIVHPWYPVLVNSKNSTAIHLVMETDIWQQKELGNMLINLQVAASNRKPWRKWSLVGCYEFEIVEEMYNHPSFWTVQDTTITKLRGQREST